MKACNEYGGVKLVDMTKEEALSVLKTFIQERDKSIVDAMPLRAGYYMDHIDKVGALLGLYEKDISDSVIAMKLDDTDMEKELVYPSSMHVD